MDAASLRVQASRTGVRPSPAAEYRGRLLWPCWHKTWVNPCAPQLDGRALWFRCRSSLVPKRLRHGPQAFAHSQRAQTPECEESSQNVKWRDAAALAKRRRLHCLLIMTNQNGRGGHKRRKAMRVAAFQRRRRNDSLGHRQQGRRRRQEGVRIGTRESDGPPRGA